MYLGHWVRALEGTVGLQTLSSSPVAPWPCGRWLGSATSSLHEGPPHLGSKVTESINLVLKAPKLRIK